jgi:hypothetical protein
LAARFGFGEGNMLYLRIGEPARWNHAVTARAIYSGKIVADNSKMVEGDMCELQTAGAFTNHPNIGSGSQRKS